MFVAGKRQNHTYFNTLSNCKFGVTKRIVTMGAQALHEFISYFHAYWHFCLGLCILELNIWDARDDIVIYSVVLSNYNYGHKFLSCTVETVRSVHRLVGLYFNRCNTAQGWKHFVGVNAILRAQHLSKIVAHHYGDIYACITWCIIAEFAFELQHCVNY